MRRKVPEQGITLFARFQQILHTKSNQPEKCSVAADKELSGGKATDAYMAPCGVLFRSSGEASARDSGTVFFGLRE
jgi:hypothetical protein